jgi:hypothetical protein
MGRQASQLVYPPGSETPSAPEGVARAPKSAPQEGTNLKGVRNKTWEWTL